MKEKANVTFLSQGEDYCNWVKELKGRYLSARLRSALSVTREVLQFYWCLGRDIATRQWANDYGSAFYQTLSRDLRREIPNAQGFSETNLRYMHYFYLLYSQVIVNHLQGVEDLQDKTLHSICT